jgi:UDP-N-acetylmuramoyl-L-alanyl-D-glutamate--2,6-diaminopimelate ligase
MEIVGITANDAYVQPGFLFVARRGAKFDAADLAAAVTARGAAAIISHRPIPNAPVPVVVVPDIADRMADLAAAFYDVSDLNLVAVTGTNGKTSTVAFVRQMLPAAASIGTVGLQADGREIPGNLTTPDVLTMHALLAAAKSRGIKTVAIEASSIGLAQGRFGHLKFSVGAFTNFTQDHLDIHGDMAEYFAAKKLLFTDYIAEVPWSSHGMTAVLNADIPEYDDLRAAAKSRGLKIISYGRAAGSDLQILEISPVSRGQKITANIFGTQRVWTVPVIGDFQAYNIMCAIGICAGLSMDAENIENLRAPLGRMDYAGTTQSGGDIYIDYAHTPDALEKLLRAVRSAVGPGGRLMILFGAGGDRDATKRPLMGRIAADLADVVYVTDDNPRTEDAAAIRSGVMSGFLPLTGAQNSAADSPARGELIEIGGRAAAIARAVSDMRRGDILLIAGKGHEDYQIIGTEKHHFSDFEEVRKNL